MNTKPLNRSVSTTAIEQFRQFFDKCSLKKWLPFMGPAYLVSVGYIDPGNWATNIEGGARFGYQLLWVLLISNLMAIILQSLSVKLGIATGKSLAENMKIHFAKPLYFFLFMTALIAAMATDLAEFFGAALGIHILFGIPLFPSAFITGIIVFAILALHRYGYRQIEMIIFGFVSIVAFAYILELFLVKPDVGLIMKHTFIPELDAKSIFVAIGMLGATVMPHNLFLHSGVVITRINSDLEHNKKIYKYAIIDSLFALNTAWFINSSMIIMAAAAFFSNGHIVSSIEGAYQTLTPLLGGFASFAFAIALLSSGLSSSVTGTIAGQYILQGFINRSIPFWVQRLVTMIPALIVIGLGVNTFKALITSQVILSLQLPFTIIPLIILTRNKEVMGKYFVNKPYMNKIAGTIALLIIFLNSLLLYQTFSGMF
ncbi:Nramp family divalent metal transporter [Tepidibacillus fermentans]|uniref:Divalent metal cation transporter MntH n=1 Tax=Tepidibacillus fermentans TaxID=1281767 RepID=A0A4R3KIQ6_9BACI|nr:Nramp family divalent metal transporter [Tepidibacillus fermentans]TCS83497.1 manganese transport protein [Tepidibacillus fermentans]